MSQGFVPVSDDGEVLTIRSMFSPRLRIPVPESKLPSRTKASPDHVRAADINFIVARYKKTGELPVSKRAPMFSDMSAPEFKEAMDLVTSAQQSFDLLPASVRANFSNDPASLLKALDQSGDPKVHQYLFDAGVLAEPPKAPTPPAPSAKKSSKAGKQPDLPLGKED